MTGRVVVIGVGNPFRRDDGAGLGRDRVAAGARCTGRRARPERRGPGPTAGPVGSGRHGGPRRGGALPAGRPGRLHTLRGGRAASLAAATASTHGLGLAETVALAAALDRLPRALVVHAVEGADFTPGLGLTDAVRAALPALVGLVAGSVRAACRAVPPVGDLR
ncbi:hydrogenase maturation protease [Kitasatospora arboriphila]